MVHRLILSYRGGAYAGWQRQTNALAVQQVVEEALEDLLGAPVRTVAASRTDAGVHARGQAVHLTVPRPFPARGLLGGLNARLPQDIRVTAAERMAEGFDARKCALAKLYSYRLIPARVLSPLDAPFAVPVDPGLDVAAVRRAAALLAGRHDFSAFALAGGSHRDPRRRLFAATLRSEGASLLFEVVGDGFLRGMVRSLVGTLLQVGAGKRSPEAFGELLAGAPRSAAGPTAPARGLVLERVFYPPPWGDGLWYRTALPS